MIKASIDIGSNSILLLAAKLAPSIEVILNESNVTGLGRDLDSNGEFLPVAMEESFEVLKSYTELLKDNDVDLSDVIVTATEASRVAKNADQFYQKVKAELGLSVQILTGEGEAFYSTQGILFDQNITDPVITIMDIGGASTELIRVEVGPKNILRSFSMPVGAVRMNNWRETNEIDDNLSKVLSDYSNDLEAVKTQTLYCVAGTMTSVGNIHLGNKSFIEESVNGHSMKTSEVEHMLQEYEGKSVEDLLALFPFLGKRAKTIYSGIILSTRILKSLNVEKIIISTYGLRYGTLISEGLEEQYVWKRF